MVWRRIGAYIIDIIIVFLIISALELFFPKNKLDNELSKQIEEIVQIQKVSDEDLEEIKDTTYKISKSKVGLSVVSIVIYILYFAVLPVYNNGQTLGKMATKIKITSSIGEKLSIWQTTLRGAFIYTYFFSLIDIVLILSLNKTTYFNASTPLARVQSIIFIICFITIIFNKGKGMHDFFGKTIVVPDVIEEIEETSANRWKEKRKEPIKKGINSDRVKNHTKRKGE